MALGESLKLFFKKYFCVSAAGGSLCFGKVTTMEHELFFEKDKEVSLCLKKLGEFKILLRLLGRNIAFGRERTGNEDMQQQEVELALSEKIFVKGTILGKIIKDKKIFEIEFDHFSYINFLFAIRDTCLFMCYPTKAQYNSMIAYHNAAATTMSDKISEVCQNLEQTELQRFMLEQFLSLNFPLIDFYSDVRKLLEGRIDKK